MRILVTGGAGYKGVKLSEALLAEGHEVTILDNFMYGYDPILRLVQNPMLTVNKKDIRNIEENDVRGYSIVYHLAAVSGYPACEANPHSAHIINVGSTKRLSDLMSDDQMLVYASTTSFYGVSSETRDETSAPNPSSIYGMTKYAGEQIVAKRDRFVAFRFATLFGVSPKMRCDLLANDFAFRAVTERSIVIYDSESVRTFLHVDDAVEAYMMVARKPDDYSGEIYNVGSATMNFSKMELAELVREHTGCKIIDSDLGDPDRRDFIISFDKIEGCGFKHRYSLEHGIRELVKLYGFYRPYSHFNVI